MRNSFGVGSVHRRKCVSWRESDVARAGASVFPRPAAKRERCGRRTRKGPGVAARAFMLPMPARYGVQVAFSETPEKVL